MGLHQGIFAVARFPADREALDCWHGGRRRASDILRTPNLKRSKMPRGSRSVQSLPKMYCVLRPPGTWLFRELFCARRRNRVDLVPISPLKKSVFESSSATAGLSSSVSTGVSPRTAGQASSAPLVQRAALCSAREQGAHSAIVTKRLFRETGSRRGSWRSRASPFP